MDFYVAFFFPFFCPYFLCPPETLSRCGKDWPVGDIDECLGRGGAGGVEYSGVDINDGIDRGLRSPCS